MNSSNPPSEIDDSELRDLRQEWERRRRAKGLVDLPTDLALLTVEFRRRDLQQRRSDVARDIQAYTTFNSGKPHSDFTFLYPAHWIIREFADDGHAEALCLGPRNADDTLNLAMAVHTFPTRAVGGKYETLDELLAAFITQRAALTEFHERSRLQGFLDEAKALEMEVGFIMPSSAGHSVETQTAAVERRIFLERDARFHELIYSVAHSDYSAYLHTFREMVRTFSFRATIQANKFSPLIQPAPTQPLAIHERSVEYRPDT